MQVLIPSFRLPLFPTHRTEGEWQIGICLFLDVSRLAKFIKKRHLKILLGDVAYLDSCPLLWKVQNGVSGGGFLSHGLSCTVSHRDYQELTAERGPCTPPR